MCGALSILAEKVLLGTYLFYSSFLSKCHLFFVVSIFFSSFPSIFRPEFLLYFLHFFSSLKLMKEIHVFNKWQHFFVFTCLHCLGSDFQLRFS